MGSDNNNSGDGRGKPNKLILGGDIEPAAELDRMSTVMVDDGGAYGDDAEPTSPFIHADDPTPPPGDLIDPDDPTPPTNRTAPAPRPRPTQAPAPRPRHSAPASAQDAEHITNTGFIPSETFKMAAVEGKKKKKGKKKRLGKFELPTFRWLDDGELQQRLAYGGGGLLGGALIGGLLGVLNSFLQGWSVARGADQIIGLALLVGLALAVMAAMKPSRVDQLMERIGLGDD